jgi:hypothetical protein
MARVFLIALIWLGCAVAWVVLGSTLVVRSGESSGELTQEVHALWGPPLEQRPPSASYSELRTPTALGQAANPAPEGAPQNTERANEAEPPRAVVVEVPVPLRASDISVRLAAEHRKKGLLWFPTYNVQFAGSYTFENPAAVPQEVAFEFPLSEANALYDGFAVRGKGGQAIATEISGAVAKWSAKLAPQERVTFRIEYRSRGTETFRYQLAQGTSKVENFTLRLSTDFAEVDFPAGSLSPTTYASDAVSYSGTWHFDSLIASAPIGVTVPRQLEPGPLASRITFFAPVGLLFFFFVVGMIAELRSVRLHPLHFFFLGCAFFAFHLLFAYLVDHVSIVPSFALASGVSWLLAVTYARLFVGWRFALLELGGSQLIYLVLFSVTFFWEGFTGLAVTLGAILTLFVLMQLTGSRSPTNLSGRSEAAV